MARFALNLPLLAVFAVLVALPTAADEPPVRHDLGEPMPQVLYSSSSAHSYATWVAASAALDSSGAFDESLFPPQGLRHLRRHLSKLPVKSGCIQYGPIYHDLVGAPSWGTRQEILTNSDLVIRGTVVGQEYGFKNSTPGKLFKLRADAVLKSKLEDLRTYYVFFPVGEFQIGDWRICKTDPRYPPLPRLGDELVVSVPHRNDANEPLLNADGYGGLGYVTIQDGKAYWSKNVKGQDNLVTGGPTSRPEYPRF